MVARITLDLIVKAAFLPVVEVLLLIGTGALMTRSGVIDKSTRTALSRLVTSVFTPALCLVKVRFVVNKFVLCPGRISPGGTKSHLPNAMTD